MNDASGSDGGLSTPVESPRDSSNLSIQLLPSSVSPPSRHSPSKSTTGNEVDAEKKSVTMDAAITYLASSYVNKKASSDHLKRLSALRKEVKKLETSSWKYESVDKLLGN